MFSVLIEEYKIRLQKNNSETVVFNTIKNWLEKRSNDGYTIVHYASFKGNIDILKKLFEYNIDPTVTNIRGITPFHMAAQGDSPNSLVYLVEKFKVNFNQKDNDNTNCLQWASYMGAENSFLYLVSLGIDLNEQNINGQTALHVAILAECTKIVKKLIQRGADINLRDIKNRTPYELAIEKNKVTIIEMFQESQGCQLCVCHNPVKKTERTYFNVYMFIFLHLIDESIVFLLLLPRNIEYNFRFE